MAIFIRRSRHASVLSARRVNQLERLVSRYFSHRRSRQLLNRRFEQRQMFRYYYKKYKTERWMGTTCKTLCALVFFICIARMLTCVSSLVLFLLRFVTWMGILLGCSLALLLCILSLRRDTLQKRINRAWNRMNRIHHPRHALWTRNVRLPQRSVYGISAEGNAVCAAVASKSDVEHFLDIIANGFEGDVLSKLPSRNAFVQNFQTTNASRQASNSIRCLKDGRENLTSSEVCNRTLHETETSVNCHLTFTSFMELLKQVDCQRSQQASFSSLRETVLKYKKDLIEKVNLTSSRGNITTAEELYEFIESNWDEWFPKKNCHTEE